LIRFFLQYTITNNIIELPNAKGMTQGIIKYQGKKSKDNIKVKPTGIKITDNKVTRNNFLNCSSNFIISPK